MAKFGKFLLSTAALVGTAATAYYIYKNVKINVGPITEEEDEDLDDFNDSTEEADAPHYVPLNTDSPVAEMAEEVAEKAEEVVEKVADVVEEAKEAVAEAVDNFSTLPEQMAVEESVEEFFNDEEN